MQPGTGSHEDLLSTRAQALADTHQWVRLRTLLEGRPAEELGPADHELLAVSAGLTGHDETAVAAWERAFAGWREQGESRAAGRVAFWLGMFLVQRARMAQGTGWFGLGARVLDDDGVDCPERWLLEIPRALGSLGRDPEAALATFQTIRSHATRFHHPELSALASLGTGQALIQLGRAEAGTALLDEAMAAALAGDVPPVATGIVYCAVILECRRIFDVRRAREWTEALTTWCDRHEGLVPFRGQCLVHRSEVVQADGDWDGALLEADAACAFLADPGGDPLLGMALYQRAELRRLRGDFPAAEDDYRLAAQAGRRTEPGLQLLQLATGRGDLALAAIRRSRAEAHGPVQRARILAAYVEIVLAAGDVADARDAADELAVTATQFGSDQLGAVADHWQAAVLLEEGDPAGALRAATRSEEQWRDLGAPYEYARARVLRARACAALGDDGTAEAELAAATSTLQALGAEPDLAALRQDAPPALPGGLSPREAEVVRLVARGYTNRQVAAELVISEKTVARHLSNVFAKTGAATRSALTAWAFTHGVAG